MRVSFSRWSNSLSSILVLIGTGALLLLVIVVRAPRGCVIDEPLARLLP